MAAQLSLSAHDMSPERGFLCAYDAADVTLPSDLAAPEQAARDLPRTLLTGRVRKHLEALPVLDLKGFCAGASDAQLRTAMVRYAFMVQAYVWGEPDVPTRPSSPSRRTNMGACWPGQQPLLPYSAYVLDNWDRLDRNGPVALDNIWMIQNFLAGQDEAWFVLVHVAIEARAGEMLAEIPKLIDAADKGDEKAVEASLAKAAKVWDDVNAIFDRMPERCDPYIYFHRVRPYIHGWKDNPALAAGLIYEGVAETNGEPQSFRGQTGSQSTIVPSMDALLASATPPTRCAPSSTSCTSIARPLTAPSSTKSASARTCAPSSRKAAHPCCATFTIRTSRASPASARATSNTPRATSTSRARTRSATIRMSAPAERPS